ncbi:MAG: hypothetical protein LBV80_00705 [Deltaproteobacteria bacterium]|jgi:hypothetical protein|nr:hypothetical protein [Deltaproteobacteria bacterium]
MGSNKPAADKGAEKTTPDLLPVAALMYLGPNRAFGLPVAYNQLFRVSDIAGLPKPLHAKAGEDKDFAACFVEIANLGKALADLKKPDSGLSDSISKVMAATQKMAQAKK